MSLNHKIHFQENEFPKLSHIGYKLLQYLKDGMRLDPSIRVGGFFKEERDENVNSSSLIDANVPDPKLSGSIIRYSSESIDYR